nr:exonuclease domain-containing protein [Nocardioides soli]
MTGGRRPEHRAAEPGRAPRVVPIPATSNQARAAAPLPVWSAAGPPPPLTQPHFAVIDVETTGLRADTHRIVEIAVVTTDVWGQVLDEWSTRINPEGPIGASHIHGLTEQDLRDAPVFADIVGELNSRLTGAAVAAHHARFDLAFLRAEYRRAGWAIPHLPALCTLEASEYHLPMLDRRRLADCCWAVGVQIAAPHAALADARATAQLLAAFMHPQVGLPPLDEHVALPHHALGMSWPLGPTLSVDQRTVRPAGEGRQLSARAYVEMARTAAAGPQPALVELVERFSLLDALDEGAPEGAIAYLEKLAEVLEDGEITEAEAADLEAVITAVELGADDLAAANQAFVRALAWAALEDGKVTRAERAELQAVAKLLEVNEKVIPALLDQAEHARAVRLSAGLGPLPDSWPHGLPLRVGDKVVFTGCDDEQRNNLEDRSTSLGVRVLGSVSPKVAMLVTDGSMNGTKAARARELGTRTLDPDTYTLLLAHLQPTLPRDVKALPKTKTPISPTTSAAPERAAHVVPSDAEASKGGLAAVPGPAVPLTPTGPNPAVVRAWARANGFEVGVRGRLPKDLVAAYVEANPSV